MCGGKIDSVGVFQPRLRERCYGGESSGELAWRFLSLYCDGWRLGHLAGSPV